MVTDLKQEMTVEVEGADGLPVTLVVRPMNPAVRLQVDRATRKAYCEAVRAGHPTDDQAGPNNFALAGDPEWEELRAALRAGAEQLARADLSLAKRYGVALAMRKNRNRLETAVAIATQRKPTADSVAAQVQFETVLVLCVYDTSGRRLFRSAEQYRRHAKDPFHGRVAEAVSRVVYGFGQSEPAEEQFLREHGLAS